MIDTSQQYTISSTMRPNGLPTVFWAMDYARGLTGMGPGDSPIGVHRQRGVAMAIWFFAGAKEDDIFAHFGKFSHGRNGRVKMPTCLGHARQMIGEARNTYGDEAFYEAMRRFKAQHGRDAVADFTTIGEASAAVLAELEGQRDA